MNLPKKCGNMYIMFDENNNPEYGFEVGKGYKNYLIKKFHIMCDKKIDTIVLPKLFEDDTQRYADIDKESEYSFHYYLTGNVKICSDCFNGIKKARIIVPFVSSVMIDWGSFEEDAEIELVLHKNLDLKTVYRRFDTGFDYEREYWTLIGDKDLTGSSRLCGDDYSVREYDYKPDWDNRLVANFKVSRFSSLKAQENDNSKN